MRYGVVVDLGKMGPLEVPKNVHQNTGKPNLSFILDREKILLSFPPSRRVRKTRGKESEVASRC